MKKVKIFTSKFRSELETEVNEFFSSHEVVDVKFSICSNDFSVLIIYLE